MSDYIYPHDLPEFEIATKVESGTIMEGFIITRVRAPDAVTAARIVQNMVQGTLHYYGMYDFTGGVTRQIHTGKPLGVSDEPV